MRSDNLSQANHGISALGAGTPQAPKAHEERSILFFGSGQGWHARGVLQAFLKRGLRPVVAPLDSCAFSTEEPLGLHIPGLGARWPEAAFVRMVPGGSFEQVTLYLGMLHALREQGIPIWNDARAIENCTDKSTTTFLLQREGLLTPKSWCGVTVERAQGLAEEARDTGRVLVQKPLFGSQGRGLKLIRRPEDLSDPEEVAGVYYLQEFVGDPEGDAKDWRLFVCQDKVLASMIRHGNGWITNVRQGGRAEAAIPSEALKEIAIRSVKAVGAKYAGVDVVQNSDGAFLVLEVNSMPAWAALQRVTSVPIADLVAEAFLAETLKMPEGEQGDAAPAAG